MKKCPYCQKGNDDDEIQCWNCGEWFETVSPPRQRTVVKPPEKEQSVTDPVDRQTKLRGLFKKYIIPVMSIIIIAEILFAISQIANFNKNAEQVAGIEPPKIDTPAAAPAPAPRPEPASVPEATPAPGSAIDLYNNALSLCEGSKCTESPKAIEYLTDAIRLQPDFANAYGARGNAYANQKEYQLALEDYNKAILLKPDKAVFFSNRGNVYKDLNKYQLAIEDYNQAIRLKPDNAEAYHNRGNAYFIQGDKSLGCSDAQKACELGNCQLLEWAKDKKFCG
jgi:tetratricopeptide (TPR) repeat protein